MRDWKEGGGAWKRGKLLEESRFKSRREREDQFYILYCKPTAVYNHTHVAPSPYMLSPLNGALPSHPIVPSHQWHSI
jgi:hypothetical protein